MIAPFRYPLAAALLLTAGLAATQALADPYGPAYTYPPTPAPADTVTMYAQQNLVADIAGTAMQTDANLVNAWGIASDSNGMLYIADNGTGVSTVYQSNGQPDRSANAPLLVTVPPPTGGMPPAAPSGIAFNSSTDFTLQTGQPAQLVFVTEDGTISGWNPKVDPANAVLKVDNSAHAVYKGLALLNGKLYAANFRENSIDVFNRDFSPAGSFTDATVPAGFAPFGIASLGGTLYVSYAKQDDMKHDDVKGSGNGFVDIFNPITHNFTRLISGLGPNNTVTMPLDSPWGMALAPAGFGSYSHELLVANFGDGRIHAFDPQTGAMLGTLEQSSGQPIAIDGLWGLQFGTDPTQTNQPVLFFTAGPGGEKHGLFGRLSVSGG